uniref:Uncharacterized protein n=1 Tax=Arundo donax TaxID=35708 RepID=A0A0A9HDU4_ARUDO
MVQIQLSNLNLWNYRTLLYWCLTSPLKCP